MSNAHPTPKNKAASTLLHARINKRNKPYKQQLKQLIPIKSKTNPHKTNLTSLSNNAPNPT